MNERAWITPKELAVLSGFDVETIYRWVRDREAGLDVNLPPHVRVGRSIRFPTPGVNAWLAGEVQKRTGVEGGPIRGQDADGQSIADPQPPVKGRGKKRE